MATTKKLWLGTLELTYANKAETEPEIETDVVKTFSGNITDGDENPSWKISIDQVRYAGSVKEFVNVRKKVYQMMKTPDTVTIQENSKIANKETLRIDEIFYGSILDNKKVTFDVETRTIENLSFVATKKREWINDEEIPIQ